MEVILEYVAVPYDLPSEFTVFVVGTEEDEVEFFLVEFGLTD